MGVYLHLFHGRRTLEEDMDDWGEDGPVFGPFPYAHTTYSSDLKCGEHLWFRLREGLVYFDGWWYGDWSVFDQEVFDEFDLTEGQWIRGPYRMDDPRLKLPEERRMWFKTEEEAQAAADALLKKMHTTGWSTRVWENGGWHFSLEHGSGIGLYKHRTDGRITYNVMACPDDGPGADSMIWGVKYSSLTPQEVQRQRDPNEALRFKAEHMRACLQPYIDQLEAVERLVAAPVPESAVHQYTHHGAAVWVRAGDKGKHWEHTLCGGKGKTPCAAFRPGEADNCPIAQATYENCVRFSTVTPMWECPLFGCEPGSQLRQLREAMIRRESWTIDRHGQFRSDLPTFGPPMKETCCVWSWDKTHMLVGASASELTIMRRTDI